MIGFQAYTIIIIAIPQFSTKTPLDQFTSLKSVFPYWLSLAEWLYKTSFHTTTKMIPFMELYGYHPSSITSYLREKPKVIAVEDHIEHQQQVLQVLKDNLTLA